MSFKDHSFPYPEIGYLTPSDANKLSKPKGKTFSYSPMDVLSYPTLNTHSALPARIPESRLQVAIDCEMIRVGSRSELAEVAIVDLYGKELLHKYVRPSGPVTDYLTHVSGITEDKLRYAKSFTHVRNHVLEILKGKEIVGHALDNDFRALRIPHHDYTLFDSAYSPQLMKPGPHGLQPNSLKNLMLIYSDHTIQEGEHSALEDARASMQLYREIGNMYEKKEKNIRTSGGTLRAKRKNILLHKRKTCRQRNGLRKW